VSKIETAKYSDLLRRALGMKGVSDVAPELSAEISGVWEIERDAPEWLFLKGVRHCSVAATRAGAGASLNTCRIRNPAGSGALIIIDVAEWGSTVTPVSVSATFSAAVAQANLATVVTAGTIDSRWGFQQPVGVISTANVGGAGSNVIYRAQLSDTIFARYPTQLILAPNSSCDFTIVSLNTVLNCNLNWHERGISALEL